MHFNQMINSEQQEVNTVIKIQQPIIKQNISPESSIHDDPHRSHSHSSINRDRINESIRSGGDRGDKYFQENIELREKLNLIEDQLQDANIKGCLWDKIKSVLETLSKEKLIKLQSVENDCSDGTILKEFTKVLREKLQKCGTEVRSHKITSVENKSRNDEYLEMYEAEKRKRFEYEQHIITLNNELDALEDENEKLKEKLGKQPGKRRQRITSTNSVASSSQAPSSQKQPMSRPTELKTDIKYSPLSSVEMVQTPLYGDRPSIQQIWQLKEQNSRFQQQHQLMLEQLEVERDRVKQIERIMEQYENQIETKQKQFGYNSQQLSNTLKKQEELVAQVKELEEIQDTLKGELSDQIKQNEEMRSENQKLHRELLNNPTPEIFGSTSLTPQHLNEQSIVQSSVYMNLLEHKKILEIKLSECEKNYKTLGEEIDRVTLQLQETDRSSKEMQYNYEVKIDDLKKVHETEMSEVVAKYKGQIIQLRDKKEDLEAENDELRDSLKQEINKQQAIVNEQQMKNSELSQRCQAEITALKAQLSKVAETVSQKQSTISKLEGQIEVISQKQNQQIVEEQQQREPSPTMTEFQNLKELLESRQVRVKQLQSMVSTYSTEVSSFKEENIRLKNELQTKKSSVFEVQQKEDNNSSSSSEDSANLQIMQGLHKIEKQQMTSTIKELKRAFYKEKQNSNTLQRNISEWEMKYYELQAEYQKIMVKVQYLEKMQITNVITEKQSQEDSDDDQKISQKIKSEENENDKIASSGNDSIEKNTVSHPTDHICQSPQKIADYTMENEKLRQENELLKEELTRYQSSIKSTKTELLQIQNYIETIKKQNIKVPQLEEKNKKLRKKLTQQKQGFISIMKKNQSVYEELMSKNQHNQKLLQENIELQRRQTEKLCQIVQTYHKKFGKQMHMHEQRQSQDNPPQLQLLASQQQNQINGKQKLSQEVANISEVSYEVNYEVVISKVDSEDSSEEEQVLK